MHSDVMSTEVHRFLEEANDLQWKKNHDYHPDRVAFLEILRTCAETGITVEQDLWAKIRKHYIALRSCVIDGGSESEPPRSRMIDIVVYMGMFAFWDRFKTQIVLDALQFVHHQPCEVNRANYHTCIQEGNPTDRQCDRCRFYTWLQGQTRRNASC